MDNMKRFDLSNLGRQSIEGMGARLPLPLPEKTNVFLFWFSFFFLATYAVGIGKENFFVIICWHFSNLVAIVSTVFLSTNCVVLLFTSYKFKKEKIAKVSQENFELFSFKDLLQILWFIMYCFVLYFSAAKVAIVFITSFFILFVMFYLTKRRMKAEALS